MWRISGTKTLVDDHITGMLEQHGHIVYNFGFVGRGNVESWESADKFFTENKANGYCLPDFVIWFHTDVLRDYASELVDIKKNNKPWTLTHLVTKSAERAYGKICKIIKSHKLTNLILIEGQAPTVEPEFSEYIDKPLHTVKNWRSKIVNKHDLPESQLLTDVTLFEYGENLDSIEFRTTELEKISKIREAMTNSLLFPDDAHPGRKAHEQLTQQVLDVIRKTNY